MNRNLIVPVAADKPEYNNSLPYVFSPGDDGIIICIKSIMGLPLNDFDNIYFTILRGHDDCFFIDNSIEMQCRRLGLKNVNIVILNKSTIDQAETIFETIRIKNITGSIYIKDADCYFESSEIKSNGVALYPIEQLEILDPRNKSYVAIDDMYYITNIIEKFVVGHHINAGGYSFENVEEFKKYYSKIRHHKTIYLSNIICAMLLDKYTFRPFMVKKYKDWGTKRMLNIK